MARILLITGGARSGKSSHAQRLADGLPGPHACLATCPRGVDAEMEQRIATHRAERAGRGWRTEEEPLDLAGGLDRLRDVPVVLVDCLTLWVTNLLLQAEQAGGELTDSDLVARCRALMAAARVHGGTVIFVTNEVGLGIVPDNALARRFRDLSGRCNQTVAAAADEVVLMVCGLPLAVKPGEARP
ncbi:MAG: bifunctional adenosylcobinamide kinase/adenosylcobinamide-phosphate guanylyltransferase [Armatimonadetes bacterium]|nr:bifunctional adenosylcobinamide kinase/adenosylcobinamide-phosphate guanylyltransferase [Armatimonadota bacterium]